MKKNEENNKSLLSNGLYGNYHQKSASFNSEKVYDRSFKTAYSGK